MLYAKYNKATRRWIIGYNPEIGGYKGRDKKAIWKQIRRNFSFARDMKKYGCVCMTYLSVDGLQRNLVTLFASGVKDTFVVKGV
jgi:hypothetical protein